MMEKLTREKLAELLKKAEIAHAEYEKTLGKRDDEWPAWYAAYIVKRLDTEDENTTERQKRG